MSVPKLKADSSRSQRPTWFQDLRSGCEKQTDYFLRIRKLQKELINREQHNLVNAMERLKQLQYPRRKPFVRNFDVPHVGSKCFPTRPLYARRDPKHRLNQQTENEKKIKPLEGKLLLPSRNRTEEADDVDSFTIDEIRRIYSMLPILNDKQIAKIVHDVRNSFPNETSTYLLQPHLPSIPNVSRKANKRLDNRLRMLTLTESPCYIQSSNSVQQIRTSQQQRKKDIISEGAAEKQKRNERKKGKNKHILAFDVDPNDSSIFSNCLSPFDEHDDEEGSPLPPPNSRPSSCLKNNKIATVTEISKDINNIGGELSMSEESVAQKEEVQNV